jgi:hypothetical protein
MGLRRGGRGGMGSERRGRERGGRISSATSFVGDIL